jgi:hypothetical protein
LALLKKVNVCLGLANKDGLSNSYGNQAFLKQKSNAPGPLVFL